MSSCTIRSDSVKLSCGNYEAEILPFGALLLGSFVGANPLGFLLEHPLGMVLALAGVSLAAAGVVWTEKLAVRA